MCFWLLQNGNRVCIAACDTFRAGAVEQLKTHCRKLNAAQKASGIDADVLLYNKGCVARVQKNYCSWHSDTRGSLRAWDLELHCRCERFSVAPPPVPTYVHLYTVA